MTQRVYWPGIAAGLIIIAGVFGFALGERHAIRTATMTKIEPPAPSIKHQDGSETLARVNTPPPPPLPEPPGAKVRTRVAVLELKPVSEPSEIQIDTVRMKDGSERVTAKGPALAGGQDFSIQIPGPPVQKWTLGGGIGFNNYTLLGARRVGPVDIGGMIQRSRAGPVNWDAQVIVIFHF